MSPAPRLPPCSPTAGGALKGAGPVRPSGTMGEAQHSRSGGAGLGPVSDTSCRRCAWVYVCAWVCARG